MAAMQSTCKTVSSVKSVALNIRYCELDLAMANHPATRENRSYVVGGGQEYLANCGESNVAQLESG